MPGTAYRVQLSPSARADFTAILRYTGKIWGEAKLLAYRDLLAEALERIRRDPEIGQQHSELPDSHRLHRVGSHVVIYRLNGQTIAVIRILHRRMSAPLHF
jgi:toxin ParE1/3/4